MSQEKLKNQAEESSLAADGTQSSEHIPSYLRSTGQALGGFALILGGAYLFSKGFAPRSNLEQAGLVTAGEVGLLKGMNIGSAGLTNYLRRRDAQGQPQ
jgi:hypothetical protein